MRFWRPTEQSKSTWLGNAWISVPGVITDVKGGVFPSTREDGIYVNFGNAQKDKDGKYGKPCIVLDDKLQAACNTALNHFWDTPLNKVDLEMDEDGNIGIAQKEKAVSTIKGADDLIKAAIKLRTTAVKQAPTPSVQEAESTDEEAAM